MQKKFNVKRFIIFIIIVILILISIIVGSYFFMISSPSKSSDTVTISVNEGQTYTTISGLLKEKGLIRSELAYKVYLKLHKVGNLEYGDYVLKKNYNVEELIQELEKGSVTLAVTKTVTFIEGKNMRYVIKLITENFDITEREILDKLEDKDYLDELINNYWFLTEDIKNKGIYYSLEGYLYPDTYDFYSNASVDDIFKKMLDNMESKLESYKEEIQKSKYTIHEMLTLASIVELESGNADDRKGVAGVFYNRLNNNWTLGSDVTTYYAEKNDNYLKDLKKSELDKCNDYNTRSSCMAGKLPIGPICNPSIDSIIASIEPKKHDYYYFVADKNGKTYFNKTDAEHTKTVADLKREGLWIEYEE